MRNYFTFNSNDSRSYGVYISGSGVFDAPETEIEKFIIPGRDGDLIGTNVRYPNIEVTYPAFIYSSFDTNLSSLKSMLKSVKSYARLTDSYHTDEFRKAVFVDAINVEPTAMLGAGKFDLVFDCKPQRWLTIGESTTTITSSGTSISNPTSFDSLPYIKVTGYGDLYIGSQKVTIQNVYSTMVIDSEVGDCYSGTYNGNPYVTFQNNNFPVLNPGANSITFSGTISKVEIVPRWWKL